MELLKKLEILQTQCLGGVSIEFNPQYSNYETVEKYLEDIASLQNTKIDEIIDNEVLYGILNTNQLVELHLYPDTPVGSYKLYHWSLELIVDKAITLLEKDKGVTYG